MEGAEKTGGAGERVQVWGGDKGRKGVGWGIRKNRSMNNHEEESGRGRQWEWGLEDEMERTEWEEDRCDPDL